MSQEALDKRFKDLHDRLTALQDATSQLQELIDRLANFNFQPGSVPLAAAASGQDNGNDDDDNDSENVVSELGAEINQILREQEEDLELLQEEIVDIRPGKAGSGGGGGGGGLQHEKARLKDGVARLGQELQR